MENRQSKIKRYRMKAEELRTIASNYHHQATVVQLEHVAKNYDQMAEALEHIERGEPQ